MHPFGQHSLLQLAFLVTTLIVTSSSTHLCHTAAPDDAVYGYSGTHRGQRLVPQILISLEDVGGPSGPLGVVLVIAFSEGADSAGHRKSNVRFHISRGVLPWFRIDGPTILTLNLRAFDDYRNIL
jgi:hypothetical protein